MATVVWVGTLSWVIIAGSLLPFVAIAQLIGRAFSSNGGIALWAPPAAIHGWVATCVTSAEAGLAWSVLLFLVVKARGSLLELRSRDKLRLIGTMLGGVVSIAVEVAQPPVSPPTVARGAWLLIQGGALGYLLSGALAERTVEGPYIVGWRAPYSFVSMVTFVAVSAVLSVLFSLVLVPILSALSSTPVQVRAETLKVGAELSGIGGVVYGFVAFVTMTISLATSHSHYPVFVQSGVKSYAQIQAGMRVLVAGVLLWAAFGMWFGLAIGVPLYGAVAGAVLGFAVGGVVDSAAIAVTTRVARR